MFPQATLRCSQRTNRLARGGGDSMTRLPYHDLLRDLPPELQRAVHHCVAQCRPTSPRAPTPTAGARNSTTRLPSLPASRIRPTTPIVAARSTNGACG